MRGHLPATIFNKLDDLCSGYVENYERTEKYQTGEWDGKFHLFVRTSTGSYRFPVGLMPTVMTALRAYEAGFEIHEPDVTYPTEGFKWVSDISLRKYQLDALMRLIRSHNGSGVISLPTGAGKTVIALQYAVARDLRFLVVVHRKELLYQWQEEIRAMLGIEATLVGDGNVDFSGRAVVAMVQTLYSLLRNKQLNSIDFPLVFFDECHTLPAHTAYQVALKCSAKYRVGLSATPTREDKQELKIFASVGELTSSVSVSDLVDAGYLAKPRFQFLKPAPVSIKKNAPWARVYKEGIVANPYRNAAIVEKAFELLNDGRQVYIHVIQIAHGKYLANQIPGSVFVSGSSKDRREQIARFKNGELRCMISTLLKEGVNIPGIDALIYAAGYKSGVMTIQTIGRCLRVAPGKEDAIIVDFIDGGHRHLSDHTTERKRTYAHVFGKYFKDELRGKR